MSQIINESEVAYNKIIVEFFKEIILEIPNERKETMLREIKTRMATVAANAMQAVPADVINHQDRYNAYQNVVVLIEQH
jgi:hypothetical protein